MPPGASRTPGRSTAKPPCPNRQAREPHNGPPRASMSSGTDFAKDRARNLLRRSNDRALQRPRSLGTRSFPRLQSIVTQWPARSRARWPQARPSVTLDDRQLAAGVEGLSVSSSANADDPVTTELGKGHYFASIACSVVTGCPACAGHDDREIEAPAYPSACEARMFPIGNAVPSRYPPVVTWTLIAANCAVFLIQVSLSPAELEVFLLRFAVIPARYFDPVAY